MGRIALLVGAAVVPLGCQTEPFGCESNEQCQVDAAAGVCESNGYCSFSDPQCESGRRYSNLAGGGLAGLCVNSPAETTGPASSSGTSPGVTTVNPMTGLTTELTTAGSSTSSPSTTSGTSAESTETGSTGGPSSGSTGGPDLDEGLVVYVSFEDVPSDDGSIAGEPGHLPASCSNLSSACPDFVPGMVGMAGRFDGIDDVIRVDDDDRLRLVDSLSMCLWSRRTGPFATDYALLSGKAFGGGSANSYELYLSDPNEEALTYDVHFSTDTPSVSGVRSAELSNDWTHLCGVWDGETWRLYVNGRDSGSEPVNAAPSYDDHPFLIGADTESGAVTHFFPGEIDEVRLYERALSAGEVMTLANEG